MVIALQPVLSDLVLLVYPSLPWCYTPDQRAKYPDTSFTPLWQRGQGGFRGMPIRQIPPHRPFVKGGTNRQNFCPGT